MAVIVCAVIMSIATVLVIRESIGALVDGLAHRKSLNTALPALGMSAKTLSTVLDCRATKMVATSITSYSSHDCQVFSVLSLGLNSMMQSCDCYSLVVMWSSCDMTSRTGLMH